MRLILETWHYVYISKRRCIIQHCKHCVDMTTQPIYMSNDCVTCRWMLCLVEIWRRQGGGIALISHCVGYFTWWRHQMETFSALLALCAGNSPVPVNSPHKGQWRGALMFTLICVWINGWVNNHEAGDLRRYRVHYDVIVMTECVHNPGL